jgi:transposase
VFIIGIDPHKGSHTAAVLDRSETVIGELQVVADRRQRERLLRFAADFTPRTWAIEAASGLGALLAQQLVAAGESVVDVPPTPSARVRLLDSGCTDKTDPHDARAAAIVALRHARLRQVIPVDHTLVLRLLADRHYDLTGLRTQAICRLHALLCGLTPGGAGCLLSAPQAGRILRGVRPLEPVEIERKGIALALLGDVRRFDSQLIATNQRTSEAKRSPDWDAEGPFAPGCRPAYPNSLRANRTGPPVGAGDPGGRPASASRTVCGPGDQRTCGKPCLTRHRTPARRPKGTASVVALMAHCT